MSKESKSKVVSKITDAFELAEDGKVILKDAELFEAIRQAEVLGSEEESTDGIKVSIEVK
jgi:hypothetical protein